MLRFKKSDSACSKKKMFCRPQSLNSTARAFTFFCILPTVMNNTQTNTVNVGIITNEKRQELHNL